VITGRPSRRSARRSRRCSRSPLTDVRTLVVRARRRTGGLSTGRAGRRSAWKKAIVTTQRRRRDRRVRGLIWASDSSAMTPGTRFTARISDFADVHEERAREIAARAAAADGRAQQQGHITNRCRAGHKRRYRRIDFRPQSSAFPPGGRVESTEPDIAHRAAAYRGWEKRYILAPKASRWATPCLRSGLRTSGRERDAVFEIPLGPRCTTWSSRSGAGPVGPFRRHRHSGGGERKAIRHAAAAPTGCGWCLRECLATIGEGAIPSTSSCRSGRPGRALLGRIPGARRGRLYPVDHTVGGGEGKTSGGRPPTESLGQGSREKTRHKKKPSTKLIVRGRQAREGQQ